jgi:hypothetical protein
MLPFLYGYVNLLWVEGFGAFSIPAAHGEKHLYRPNDVPYKKALSGAMAESSACSKKVKLLFIRCQSKKTVLSLQEILSRISLRTVLTSLYNAAARDRCLS